MRRIIPRFATMAETRAYLYWKSCPPNNTKMKNYHAIYHPGRPTHTFLDGWLKEF